MRFLLSILFFSLTFLSFAQPPAGAAEVGSIDGKVFDSITKTPLDYVSIRLCSVTDSSAIAAIFTDDTGGFALYDLPSGNYFLKVEVDGYNPKIIPGISLSREKPLRKLGNISLSVEQTGELDKFVVTADRNVLQVGIDKKVYNVGEDISVTGGSANDVLNNVPSIEIDQDGKISLRGDGNVTILIDGRPSSLSGGNGKSLLDGISAASIERIEIVTNPSAKYDPDGTSGIINIVLKKNIKRGLNGSVNLSGATGNAYNGSVSLNMRNTRFNIFGNYAYDYKEGYRNNFNDQTQTYDDSIVYFQQKRYGEDKGESHNLKLGMDIYLKDRNTLSWNVSGVSGYRNRYGDQTNYRFLGTDDTLGYWHRSAYDPGQNQNLDFGLNYNWEFKEEKGSIDWNAYQSLGNSANQGYYDQYYDVPSDTITINQRLFSAEQNNITTLSMDVVRILKKNWRSCNALTQWHPNIR